MGQDGIPGTGDTQDIRCVGTTSSRLWIFVLKRPPSPALCGGWFWRGESWEQETGKAVTAVQVSCDGRNVAVLVAGGGGRINQHL